MNLEAEDLLIAGGVAASVGVTHYAAHRAAAQPVGETPENQVLQAAGWTKAGVAVTAVSFIGTLAALHFAE